MNPFHSGIWCTFWCIRNRRKKYCILYNYMTPMMMICCKLYMIATIYCFISFHINLFFLRYSQLKQFVLLASFQRLSFSWQPHSVGYTRSLLGNDSVTHEYNVSWIHCSCRKSKKSVPSISPIRACAISSSGYANFAHLKHFPVAKVSHRCLINSQSIQGSVCFDWVWVRYDVRWKMHFALSFPSYVISRSILRW